MGPIKPTLLGCCVDEMIYLKHIPVCTAHSRAKCAVDINACRLLTFPSNLGRSQVMIKVTNEEPWALGPGGTVGQKSQS